MLLPRHAQHLCGCFTRGTIDRGAGVARINKCERRYNACIHPTSQPSNHLPSIQPPSTTHRCAFLRFAASCLAALSACLASCLGGGWVFGFCGGWQMAVGFGVWVRIWCLVVGEASTVCQTRARMQHALHSRTPDLSLPPAKNLYNPPQNTTTTKNTQKHTHPSRLLALWAVAVVCG